MDDPLIVAALAQAAIHGGAAAVRIEGVNNVAQTRKAIAEPIIGIVKVDIPHSPVRITPYVQNVRDLASAGADIIAVDATSHPRPETVESLVEAIRSLGIIAMADCEKLEDGISARQSGADILASTMSGYTGGEVPSAPDTALVSQLATLGSFVIAEGRYNAPELAADAIAAGANAVVVGTAITRTEIVTSWFKDSVHRAGMNSGGSLSGCA